MELCTFSHLYLCYLVLFIIPFANAAESSPSKTPGSNSGGFIPTGIRIYPKFTKSPPASENAGVYKDGHTIMNEEIQQAKAKKLEEAEAARKELDRVKEELDRVNKELEEAKELNRQLGSRVQDFEDVFMLTKYECRVLEDNRRRLCINYRKAINDLLLKPIVECGTAISEYPLCSNAYRFKIDGQQSPNLVLRRQFCVKKTPEERKACPTTMHCRGEIEMTLNHASLWSSIWRFSVGEYHYNVYSEPKGQCSTLAKYRKSNPRLFEGDEGEKMILAIALHILDALCYLETVWYVHFRLSPDTIVLSEDQLKKTLNVQIAGLENIVRLDTKMRVDDGNKFYRPPEIAPDLVGNNLEVWVNNMDDVYALGLVIAFMMQGRHVFEDVKRVEQLEDPTFFYKDKEPPEGSNSHVLNDIISTCTPPDRGSRISPYFVKRHIFKKHTKASKLLEGPVKMPVLAETH